MEEEILEEEIQVETENYVVKADLSDYYTKEETNTLLGEKQNSITSESKLDSDLVDDTNKTNLFVTSTEKSTWNGKQDTLTFDSTPTLNSNNPVTSNGIALALQNAGGGIEIIKMLKNADQATRITTGQEFYDKAIVQEKDIYVMLTDANGDHNNAFCSIISNTINDGSGSIVLSGSTISIYTDYSNYGVGYKMYDIFQFTIIVSNGVVSNAFITTTNTYLPGYRNQILGMANNTSYTPTGNYNPATKKYVDDNIPKPMYLGKITEHNSTDTAIDLNSLDVGYYMITHISRNANLYLQATYKDNVIRGTYNPYYYGMCQNDVLYLRLEKKITDDLSSGTVVGYFTYTDFYETDRNIAYYMKSIQINNNNISMSGGSSIEYQIATRNTTQTISGKKTFTTLPESSVIPTTNNQLVNKTYVDGLIGNINTVLDTLTTVQEDD